MEEQPDRQLINAFYTLGEEIANAITHGIGAVLSIVGLTLLIVFAALYGDIWHIVGVSVYGTSLVLLYLTSTLYHCFQAPPVKAVLRKCDHAAIYLLIAGTYTPILLVKLRTTWGVGLLIALWLMACAGIVFKIYFIDDYDKWATLAYVLMGWSAVLVMRDVVAALAGPGLVWLAAGGVFYTLGVPFYLWNRLPYNHAIWHVFVLAGSICHYFSILFYVVPLVA